jgi:hypothetical protein
MLDKAEAKGYIVYLKTLFLSDEDVAESKRGLREYLAQDDEESCLPLETLLKA